MTQRLPLTLLTALLGASSIILAEAGTKPNILHIVADDLGWQDVGFNGCKDIRTPNLDGLASQGAKLSQFYVLPMCTPTRACLMTGRYPFRYGLQTAVIPSVSDYGLDTSEVLMPQILKEAGYDTAIIGKWHLGHADRKFWPRQRGFDYQYGAMIGELDYFTHSEHGVLDWYRDNEPVKEEGYTTNLLGDDAVRYIKSRDGKKPFYLYLTFNAPHTPYQAPADIIAKYNAIQDPTRRTYAAMVDCLDANIGKVIAALEVKGLRDNTIIIFHSDNGGTKNAMFAGVMADMSKITIPCDNGPYRDGKGSLFEGACRVAACVNWPGKIKAQAVDGMIHAADILPTLSNLAGASTKNCKPLDGVDVWEVIANGAASPRSEVVYNVEPFRAAIRQGSHKLIWRSTLPSSVDLYDLEKDPSETRNIAQDNPQLVESMKLRLNALAAEAAQPLFLADQFKVIMRNMNGKPLLPWEPGYSDAEAMPDAGKQGH
ncbi:MAG TPA: sulfatase-like hydrolase/transferase [Luteolibacter sp.]|nr:sulfatase-like hydrolase/transferase [Luteolibacter sp.]